MNKTLTTALIMTSVFLLASCGGKSPAPWSKPDDSPWKDKRTDSAAAEQAYQPATLEAEPIAAEPIPYEPMSEMDAPRPEAVMAVSETAGMSASDMPMPEAFEAETMVTASPEDAVMNMAAGSYAVQVYASKGPDSAQKFIDKNGLEDLKVVKTDRGGEIFYVIVGLHDDKAAAIDAAIGLEQKLGASPWVRPIAGLQKIIAVE